MKRLGIILLIGSGVLMLIPLWWWAITGLSQEIGLASGLTLFVAALIGLILWVEGGDRECDRIHYEPIWPDVHARTDVLPPCGALHVHSPQCGPPYADPDQNVEADQ